MSKSLQKIENLVLFLIYFICSKKLVSVLRNLKFVIYVVAYPMAMAMVILEIYRLTHLRGTLRL